MPPSAHWQGGAVGAAVGAAQSPSTLTRGGGALLLGGVGALVGAEVGRAFPLLPGRIVYER